jgi:hydrogenase 3 maturation protease
VSIETLKENLEDFIEGAYRIAILGIGNLLRTDDGIGPVIVKRLDIRHPAIYSEEVGSVPEAFARNLADFGAQRVIMVDAADMKKSPGHVELVARDRIGGIALSTHSMPLSFLMMYLEDATDGKTTLLGVQPKSLQFGEGLTSEIEEVVRKIIDILNEVLNQHFGGLDNVSDN